MRQSKINLLHVLDVMVVTQMNKNNEYKNSLLYWLFAIDIEKFKLYS